MSDQVQILLLRGINLGPSRRVSMPELRLAFEAAGMPGARTYVQSGNIVLRSADAPEALARRTEQLIAERFGFDVPVIARTRDELAGIIGRDPFPGTQVPGKLYQVTFLADDPPAGVSDKLAALAVGEERFVAAGREWYSLHPEGIARSKLASRMSAANLGVGSTARNWITVRTLLAMADERSA